MESSTSRVNAFDDNLADPEKPNFADLPRPKITVFTRSYPPAYLSGGPARSLYALIEYLGAEFDFSIVTAFSNEIGVASSEELRPGQWSTTGIASISRQASHRMSARTTRRLLKESDPEAIYLNSLFDFHFAILPLIVSRALFRKVPVILAPRGELSVGALALKRVKKTIFLLAFRLLRLHMAVAWHASTGQERDDIQRVFGRRVKTYVAIDLRSNLFDEGVKEGQDRRSPRDSPLTSLVFFSRIVPKKNLTALIEAMMLLRDPPNLFVAGPIEDDRYWRRCRELINRLPRPGCVEYVGTIPADDAVRFLGEFDLFVLPTLGENFGHVVLEALAAGTPVIVGRETPWRCIETSGAGWMCDAGKPEAIAELIERFCALDKDTCQRMRTAARRLACEVYNDSSSIKANRSMFYTVISGFSGCDGNG
jgi:glycosyltransferase involved in cell wall biosynthesis